VRGFTDRPLPTEVLQRVLSAAAWSPSRSNPQPWHIYAVTGAPLAQLKKLATERVAAGDPWDEREFVMYPPAPKSPYGERRSAVGKERYSALGIARDDWEACQTAAIANWDCFGAPAALFCYIDRDLGLPQWRTSGCICRPSCCCSARRGCTVAHRWRGRRFVRRSRTSCNPRTSLASSAACQSGTRTSRWITRVRPVRHSTRR
jgi:hypothetical protein